MLYDKEKMRKRIYKPKSCVVCGKKVEVEREEVCSNCQGDGCKICKWTGVVVVDDICFECFKKFKFLEKFMSEKA